MLMGLKKIFVGYSVIRGFIFLSAVVLSCFSCSIFQRGVDLNRGGVSEASYYSKLDFEYVRDKLIVPVIIDKDTFRFIFDTGSPTIISEKLQQRFSYPSVVRDTVVDIHGNSREMDVVLVDSLFLNQILFEDIPALVTKMDQLPLSCYNVDGFIGSNMLRNSIVGIDLDARSIEITDDINRFEVENYRQTAMHLDRQSSPFISLSLHPDVKTPFLFDTGSHTFINLSLSEYRSLEDRIHFEIYREGHGSGVMGLFGTGEKKVTYQVGVDSLFFCKTTFMDPLISVTPTNSKMGVKLLEYGPVVLDYRKERLLFRSQKERIRYRSSKISEFGFIPVLKENSFRVGVVWDNSLADSLGLQPGYEIIRVNEFNFQTDLKQSFCNVFIHHKLRSADTLNVLYRNNFEEDQFIQLIRK